MIRRPVSRVLSHTGHAGLNTFAMTLLAEGLGERWAHGD